MRLVMVSEFRRQWLEFRRYPTEFISQIVIMVVAFYGLFLGASYMAGSHIVASRLDGVIVGYLLWTLAMSSVGAMGWELMNEAQSGTLEQLLLNRRGPVTILLARNIVTAVYNVIFIAIVLVLIMLITRRHLAVSWSEIIPFVLAIASAMGLGFYVASITILYKRSNQFLGLLQFVLLFLVMTPFSSFAPTWRWLTILVPIAPMNGMLREMMTSSHSSFVSPLLFWWSILNVVLWLGTGLYVFDQAVRRAKRRGILGHY